MAGFSRQQDVLHCDAVALADIAREAGTPVHVYSGPLLDERYRALAAAFSDIPHRLHYAIKANGALGIVRRLRGLGASADANSGGEIEVALRAGFAPSDIVLTGVGKTRHELQQAVGMGLAAINAESPGEVGRLAALAEAHGKDVRIAIRVNPDIEAGSHPHISTGSRATKFGMSVDDARAMAEDVSRRPRLTLVGLHVHIGSQITTVEPLSRAAETLSELARDLRARGIALEHLDIGGGLGISYAAGQAVLTPDDYARAVVPHVRSSGLRLMLEPGRWLVGPIGVLVTEVVDLKRKPDGGWFVIVDAGMTDLMRPALYGAWHTIEAVDPRSGPSIHADIVGPVCETTDTLGAGRMLPPVEVGDLLAIRDTGAYGAVMASNYNRRPIAPEVLVDANAWRIIRRRQTVNDMMQWET